jgi:hypothetical protein
MSTIFLWTDHCPRYFLLLTTWSYSVSYWLQNLLVMIILCCCLLLCHTTEKPVVVLFCIAFIPDRNISRCLNMCPPDDLIYLHLKLYIFARFDVFTAALLTKHVFWNVMQCHWLSGFQHFKGTTIFWNVRNCSPDTLLHPIRQILYIRCFSA